MTLRQKLGESSKLKWLRKLLLQTNNTYKTARVLVSRVYGNQQVRFKFVAAIKIAARARSSNGSYILFLHFINHSYLKLN